MADMQVIVRLQDRGALRLDHLHDQALCEPEGRGDLLIIHIMPHRVQCWYLGAGLSVSGRRGMVGPHLRYGVAFKPDEPDQAAGGGARPAPDLADSSDKGHPRQGWP